MAPDGTERVETVSELSQAKDSQEPHPYGRPHGPWGHCVHGVGPLYICGQCIEGARREQREDLLYATLAKFADAVDGLARVLAEGEAR